MKNWHLNKFSGLTLLFISLPHNANADVAAAAERYLVREHVILIKNRHIANLLNKKEYAIAAEKLRTITKHQQDSWGEFALGNLYAAGFGVEKSQRMAFQHYLRAANDGNYSGQQKVATAYLDGIGVMRNPTLAGHWFKLGNALPLLVNSYLALAKKYHYGFYKGKLIPVNNQKYEYYLENSQKILLTLGKYPDGAAAYAIGLSYIEGDKNKKRKLIALHWMRRALTLNYSASASRIIELTAKERR